MDSGLEHNFLRKGKPFSPEMISPFTPTFYVPMYKGRVVVFREMDVFMYDIPQITVNTLLRNFIIVKFP